MAEEQQVPSQPTGTAPTSQLAIWALVCGILSIIFCAFAAIPALILAPKAISEIDASGGKLQGRQMAVVGRILGIIGVVLLALGVLLAIASIFLPLMGFAFCPSSRVCPSP